MTINLDDSETKGIRRRRTSRDLRKFADLCTFPWCGWLFVYAFVLFCFSTTRCLSLGALVEMYGSPQEYTTGFKIAALGLGFMEDFVCTTYFICLLWVFDVLKSKVVTQFSAKDGVATRVVWNIITFAVSWLLFIIMMAPFVADLMLVANRNMRFTLDLVAAVIRERHHMNAAPISPEEIQRGYEAAAILVVVATFFAFVRTSATWADLSSWNPSHALVEFVDIRTRSGDNGIKYEQLSVEDGSSLPSESSRKEENSGKLSQVIVYTHALRIGTIFIGLIGIPAAVVALRCTCSPLVVYSGLNATLNELFGHAFQPAPTDTSFASVKGDQPWVEMYIHPTEKHELFGNETLYRRTTGFKGSLAFDVDVSEDNPPNVLVIGVESFRFRDSRYLVGEKDPSNLFKGTNLTITPNFDRWAKRGVALRNIWSSNPTSRSLESMLFAQVPYDSDTKTGITGGREDTKLSGLPQLFGAKGYDTYFTTGSTITLDKWNVFLPTHGYQNVWEAKAMITLCEKHLKIKRHQWFGPEKRAFNWGVHDDLSFRILGDLLRQQTKKQKKRVAKGYQKKPVFITHYTISSHSPFQRRPTWYTKAEKPDFSALYEGEERAKEIQDYLEMRYFTDLELGKFMDRMEKEGILKDSIVVIMGDHGQAPEAEIMNTHEESVTRVAGAIIAERRLGKYAGYVVDDAAEQYDILNTLADITGLPEGGFVQNGVGRSLKRKATYGERPVFSNDPNRKMAIVRGHQRLRYDRVTDSMLLHDTENDYAMKTDLFSELSPEKQAEWKALRDNGRRVSAYYKQRWDENCLLDVTCIGDNW
ncbi:Sulfatase [Phytophthora megakarya]|uniref:Sulfatase n=1 Tax=Phytophthora megakarya TaxID=4795 RepID=A0A225VSQ9_9STRA|nr:Sulfatase [Phytophthora megakarya]